MELRLIEVVLPEEEGEKVEEIVKEESIWGIWREKPSHGETLIRILPAEERIEAVLDLLERRFSAAEGIRIILLPVEASIPRPEPEEREKPEQDSEAGAARISREELYAVTTFLVQGIRPLTWWEADRARKAARIAILRWLLLLSVLIIVIPLAQRS